MTITIDGAGRVVIPKAIRERLELLPGSELEVDVVGSEVHLAAITSETKLVRERGVLVYNSASSSDIDIADFINRQREGRGVSDFE